MIFVDSFAQQDYNPETAPRRPGPIPPPPDMMAFVGDGDLISNNQSADMGASAGARVGASGKCLVFVMFELTKTVLVGQRKRQFSLGIEFTMTTTTQWNFASTECKSFFLVYVFTNRWRGGLKL